MPLMIDTLELFEEAPRRAAMREGAMVLGGQFRRVQAWRAPAVLRSVCLFGLSVDTMYLCTFSKNVLYSESP